MKLILRLTLLVCLLFTSGIILGQKAVVKKVDSVKKPDKSIVLTSALDRLHEPVNTKSKNKLTQRNVYNVDKLPIFCKIEHKLAKSSNVNVMMRLGSLDYVNKLEGKN